MSFKELLQQCQRLASQKQIQEAMDAYLKWISATESTKMDSTTKSECAIAYNNLGQLKYLGVDFHGAVEDYDKAISYDPNLASSYYNRGTIMYRMGKFQMAHEDMKKAVSLSPDNEEFQIGLQRTRDELGSES